MALYKKIQRNVCSRDSTEANGRKALSLRVPGLKGISS